MPRSLWLSCIRAPSKLGVIRLRLASSLYNFCSDAAKNQEYVQGQSPAPNIREYFYYIDHLGQLFLDDARMKNFTSCFKDKDFLVFFFNRLRINQSGHYTDTFPYVSLCGRERNYIRCDDRPIVYTHIFDKTNPEDSTKVEPYLAYCNAGDRLAVKFEPDQLCMLPENGRVYYPASEKLGGVGLVRSALAMELSSYFRYEKGQQEQSHPPSHVVWRGKEVSLSNALWPILRRQKGSSQ